LAEIYRLPSVSPTMELGTIAARRLAQGEAFKSGAVIAEIGTDKATMEAEIFEDGVLVAWLVEDGDEVPVGAPMAIWAAKAGEDVSALLASAKAELAALKGGAAAPAPAAPAATPVAAPAPVAAPEPVAAPAAAAPVATPAPVEIAAAPPRTWMGKPIPADFMEPPGDARRGAPEPTRTVATPLARKVAADLGVDLSRVQGTGPGGRVLREDVERKAAQPAPVAATAPAGKPDTTVKLTQMRRTIAKRLLQSHQDIPTFFLTASLDVGGFVQLRAALKAQLPDLSVSYNDMLIAAVARALSESPMANASWTDSGIIQHGRVDIGVAVALPEGLITPVIRNADKLRLSEISGAVRDLAKRAKEGKLKPEEYTGGTFTISNLGMFGIDHFTAIINPPEAGILAVGKVAEVPVVVGGQLAVGWRMDVTLTCDHRVMDGAVGAAFLSVLRRYVETPALLLA
jgi:pyruvate dehydrogenase E2 component (dihydrolipoamide acetyltransferase)